MNIVFGLVLLLLVVAVVVLFAMFGELASRVPPPAEPDHTVRPYERARIGASPKRWPKPVEDFIRRHRDRTAVLIVLSASCASCNYVARQISRGQDNDGQTPLDMILLISSSSAERAHEFIDQYGLDSVPYYIDAGGTWVTESFGITISPCALLLDGGALTSALIFQDFTALQAALTGRSTGKERIWPTTDHPVPEPAPSLGEGSSARSAPVP